MATIDDVITALQENRRILRQIRKMVLYSLVTQGEFSNRHTDAFMSEIADKLDEVISEG